jgi:hypothetical protein
MSIRYFLQVRNAAKLAALICVWLFVVNVPRVAAQTGAIEFKAKIPRAPEEMQIFTLETARPPIEFLNEKLKAGKLPELKEEKKAFFARSGGKGDEYGLVRAFADPATGEAQLLPNFAELVRMEPERGIAAERATSVARAALEDEKFVARDVTKLQVGEPITVMGAEAPYGEANGKAKKLPGSKPRTVLTIVPARRFADGFPVFGRGSHAAISVANNGTVVGAVRRWRTAKAGERVRTTVNAEQARGYIERQLRAQVANERARAVVDKVEVAYYDANEKYLQPVYYFEATVTPRNERTGAIKVAGYVPLAKELEAIPDLTAKPEGPTPEPAKEISLASPQAPDPADISLGEYANRDWPNDNGYLTMSNSFLSGLTFVNHIVPGLLPPVNRTQWVDAFPFEVMGPASKIFMNAVNVAYTVPHGNWLLNTTLRNDTDFWFVTSIGTGGNPGYGSAAGGVLATWVIMSCEVIPSMYDRQNEAGGTGNPQTAFDAWWPVFQGLHNAIGFRTIMFYPDDALQFGFGLTASLGGDVNAAWFQEVAIYDGNDGTYVNGHLKAGVKASRYDAASSMIDARNLGQSIYNVGAQGASRVLWNFWMND